jgi:NADP-dependent 3-hydroxy acid dehydrogenase YdfG
MKLKLKPINEQVIVITGASSGIGLATARMAAERGAHVIAAARQESALQKLEQELNTWGRRAIHVSADVSKQDDVRRIADAALIHSGG